MRCKILVFLTFVWEFAISDPLEIMKRSLRLFLLLFVAVISFGAELGFAQEPSAPQQDTTIPVRRRRTDYGLVKNIAVMPYATLSYNLQSGQAFPKSAQGVGYGFGIAFDFAPDHQPLGLYVDFAYQDM